MNKYPTRIISLLVLNGILLKLNLVVVSIPVNPNRMASSFSPRTLVIGRFPSVALVTRRSPACDKKGGGSANVFLRFAGCSSLTPLDWFGE